MAQVHPEDKVTQAVPFSARDMFVNYVNPRLKLYSRPLYIAMVIFPVTWSIVFLVTMGMLAQCKHRYLTSFGTEHVQVKFFSNPGICLEAAERLQDHHTNHLEQMVECRPRQWMFDGPLPTYANVPLAKWCPDAWGNKADLSPCDSSPTWPGDCGLDSDGNTGTCQNNEAFQMIWSENICPTLTSTVGAALGYAGYIEFGVTISILFIMLKTQRIQPLEGASMLHVAGEEMEKAKSPAKKMQAMEERLAKLEKEFAALA